MRLLLRCTHNFKSKLLVFCRHLVRGKYHSCSMCSYRLMVISPVLLPWYIIFTQWVNGSRRVFFGVLSVEAPQPCQQINSMFFFSIFLKSTPKLENFCSSNNVESCLCKALLFVEMETPPMLYNSLCTTNIRRKNFTFVDFRNPADTYRTINPYSTCASWQYINFGNFLTFWFLEKEGSKCFNF